MAANRRVLAPVLVLHLTVCGIALRLNDDAIEDDDEDALENENEHAAIRLARNKSYCTMTEIKDKCLPCNVGDGGCTDPGTPEWCNEKCQSGFNDDSCPAASCFCEDAIVLSVDLGEECKESLSCNFFQFQDNNGLAPKVISKDPRGCTPTGYDCTLCICNLQNTTLGSLEEVSGEELVKFQVFPEDPCDERTCWRKYSQFRDIARRARIRKGLTISESRLTSANHWEFSCDAEAKVTKLKTQRALQADLEEVLDPGQLESFMNHLEKVAIPVPTRATRAAPPALSSKEAARPVVGDVPIEVAPFTKKACTAEAMAFVALIPRFKKFQSQDYPGPWSKDNSPENGNPSLTWEGCATLCEGKSAPFMYYQSKGENWNDCRCAKSDALWSDVHNVSLQNQPCYSGDCGKRCTPRDDVEGKYCLVSLECLVIPTEALDSFSRALGTQMEVENSLRDLLSDAESLEQKLREGPTAKKVVLEFTQKLEVGFRQAAEKIKSGTDCSRALSTWSQKNVPDWLMREVLRPLLQARQDQDITAKKLISLTNTTTTRIGSLLKDVPETGLDSALDWASRQLGKLQLGRFKLDINMQRDKPTPAPTSPTSAPTQAPGWEIKWDFAIDFAAELVRQLKDWHEWFKSTVDNMAKGFSKLEVISA